MVAPGPMTPEVVRRQVVLEELDVAPDGRAGVVVRRSVVGDRYRRAIWLVPLDGGAPRRLTSGIPPDTHPRLSPDGRHVAFLSARPDEGAPVRRRRGAAAEGRAGRSREEPATDVWLLALDTGLAYRLTRARHGVRGFAWAPDGRRIAFWGPVDPLRFSADPARSFVDPPGSHAGHSRLRSPSMVRRIATADWRWDEEGFRDRRVHLSVIAARPGARVRRLTAGDFDVAAPAWDADGRSLVFCAALGERADLYPRPRVLRVDARGEAEPSEVAGLRGVVDAVAPSPDGHWLALVGVDVEDAPDDAIPGLFIAPADGRGRPMALAPGLDLPVGVQLDTDLNGWMSSSRIGPFWRSLPDGSSELVALVTRRGRSLPWRFPVDAAKGRSAAEPAPMAEAESACWALAVGAKTVAVLGTLGTRAMELMTVGDEGLRTVTSFGSAWQRRLRTPVTADLEIEGPGGPIETWLVSPEGAGSSALPLVVDIHGGPLGGWAPAPSLEVAMLAAAGYRVALPNIRGSAGYGAAWIRPLLGRWGGPDADDVLAVVDRLVATGLADAARIGLLGLSYGGFLVNWLVGASPGRFAAAVSEAGVSNQVASWALSDSGPDYDLRAGLGDPLTPTGVRRLWRQSPLRLAASVRTPLLLLQGADDMRCPAADNEQLFVALRALGRTVEYVSYPGSSHTYAITGRPGLRIDRHRRMLEWFGRYLG